MPRSLLCLLAITAIAAAPFPYTPPPDLTEYRTADTAVPAKLSPVVARSGKGPGYLGILAGREGDKLTVREVQAGSPAASTVEKGDVLLSVDGVAVNTSEALRELIQSRAAGDKLGLSLARQGKRLDVTVTLAATSRPLTLSGQRGGAGRGGRGGAFFAPPPLWKQPVYRLAVVPIEYPDVKADKKITPRKWEEAFFSTGTYKTGPTGETVHGSLNDYFREQSYGKFRIEGRAFAPVLVSKKRAEYVEGSGTTNKTALPTEALTKLLEREGADRLTDFDGVCFLYAGSRTGSNRGSTMESIGLFAPEFAKLLGLPNLEARTENAGSEGLGPWCLMSDGARGSRPGHLSAWCKEQMGWLTPVVLDPTVRQKLVLAPVQASTKECFKVLVRPDGSEYFLLENRMAKGFDANLPGQGLLIWRVAGGRPTLEESHGVTSPKGPTVHLAMVPYPSKANNAFTPITTPSSRSAGGGGLPVSLTSIRRLSDGRITLHVGYEYH